MLLPNQTQLEVIALNLSQAGAPDWVQLIPGAGAVRGVDGREWTMNDAPAIVEAFKSRSTQLPIDIEHATQVKGAVGEAAPAVGWIEALEARVDGLWGKVAWNAAGEKLIGDRSYRYLSPVFTFDPTSKAIGRMVSAGLTNNPNLDLVALNSESHNKETPKMKAVLEALGLNSSASEADAVLAINNMKTDHTTALNAAQIPDPEKFVPKADHQLALNKVKDFEAADEKRTEDAINSAVDAAIEAGKIAPASKDYHVAACKANGVEAFNTAVEAMPNLVADTGLDKKDPAPKAGALSEEEQAVCSQMGMDPEEFAKAKAAEDK